MVEHPVETKTAIPKICDVNVASDNADTLSIMAGGMWFSDKAQCNREIPINLTAVLSPIVDDSDGSILDWSDNIAVSGKLTAHTTPPPPVLPP